MASLTERLCKQVYQIAHVPMGIEEEVGVGLPLMLAPDTAISIRLLMLSCTWLKVPPSVPVAPSWLPLSVRCVRNPGLQEPVGRGVPVESDPVIRPAFIIPRGDALPARRRCLCYTR